MYNALKNVLSTLNKISVEEKKNIENLLGCILLVENILTEMEKEMAEDDGNGERENG